ncbi:hypothetical protein E2C01_083127 [Portunus trituberculatus]|uniref:Uncharacterized protein n=1 Tax=Portunus trituberculatus TaxID=210409 RepID=A0A5B7J5K3_PORTR|nr:hypothetical protein [Portunus trituberculatus]
MGRKVDKLLGGKFRLGSYVLIFILTITTTTTTANNDLLTPPCPPQPLPRYLNEGLGSSLCSHEGCNEGRGGEHTHQHGGRGDGAVCSVGGAKGRPGSASIDVSAAT